MQAVSKNDRPKCDPREKKIIPAPLEEVPLKKCRGNNDNRDTERDQQIEYLDAANGVTHDGRF
jgi:hypothetical protein